MKRVYHYIVFSVMLLGGLMETSTVSHARTVTELGAPELSPAGTLTICDSTSIRFRCTAGYRSYQWSDGQDDSVVTMQFTSVGTYTVWVAVRDRDSALLYSDTATVVVTARPGIPHIVARDGNVLTEPVEGVRYQWYYNQVPLGGPQSNVQKVFQSGWYKLRVINKGTECWRESAELRVDVVSCIPSKEFESLSMCSIRWTGSVLELSCGVGITGIDVYSMTGKCLYTAHTSSTQDCHFQIGAAVPSGNVYGVQVHLSSGDILHRMLWIE